MPKIVLVCSVHKENGLCNAQQLRGILDLIAPDVLFQEIPYFDFLQKLQEIPHFGFLQNNNLGNEQPLEMTAITEYLTNHDLRQVPVDTLGVSASEHSKYDYVVDRVLHAGPELKNLFDRLIHFERTQGFGYLNSRRSDNMQRQIDSLISNSLKKLKDERLFASYASWKDYNTRREEAMIQNIYDFTRTNIFNTGVFLFGAGHRQGLIKKVQKIKKTSATRIDWKLYNRVNGTEVSRT